MSKTLRELSQTQAQRQTIDVDKLADALLARPPASDVPSIRFDSSPLTGVEVGVDLVAAGIAVVAALLR